MPINPMLVNSRRRLLVPAGLSADEYEEMQRSEEGYKPPPLTPSRRQILEPMPVGDPVRAERAAATLRPTRLSATVAPLVPRATPSGLRGETIGPVTYRRSSEFDPEGLGYDINPATGRLAGYSAPRGIALQQARRAALLPQVPAGASLAPLRRGETIPEYLEDPYVDLRPILTSRGVPLPTVSGFGAVRRSQVEAALKPFLAVEPDRFSLSPGQTRFFGGKPVASLPPSEPQMSPYQEASLDIQRQRLELSRQAAEERRKAGEAGELTPAQKNSMLHGLRSLVLRIRQHPIMGRQVGGMSDEELMAQEAEVTYGLSLDDLRPSGRVPETPNRPSGPGGSTPIRQPRTAEEYLQILRGE